MHTLGKLLLPNEAVGSWPSLGWYALAYYIYIRFAFPIQSAAVLFCYSIVAIVVYIGAYMNIVHTTVRVLLLCSVLVTEQRNSVLFTNATCRNPLTIMVSSGLHCDVRHFDGNNNAACIVISSVKVTELTNGGAKRNPRL